MKSKQFPLLAALVASIAPLIYLWITYPTIPDQVALHFNLRGVPDRFGAKSELWLLASVMAVAGMGVYLLLANIHRLDPKRAAGGPKAIFVKLGLIIAIFLALLNTIILLSARQNQLQFTRLLLPAIGLLFAVLGNYMPQLKPNYFAGIRLPWTLENEDNWRITHQVAGRWWFGGGLAIAAISPLLPPSVASIYMLVVMLVIVAVPVYTSWRIFKTQKSSPQ